MKKIVMFRPEMNPAAADNAAAILRTRWIGEGAAVRRFENRLKERFSWKHCLATNSGTAALHLALIVAGVGHGDEVVTTAMTCTATNMPILALGAKPVFADVQFWTGNIDPADVEKRVTKRTKAILCIHWGGYPCNLDKLNEIGKDRLIPVVEDAAHALGATYRGRSVGDISAFAMFSFQAIKQLTTVDGGALVTPHAAFAYEARLRRWFGIDRESRKLSKKWPGYREWNQTLVGYKYHMNNVAATVGLSNLEPTHFDAVMARRHDIAATYRRELAGADGLHLFERAEDRTSADWLFTVHVERRSDFHHMMNGKGIETSVCHIRNDQHAVFGPLRKDLPVLDEYCKSYICLPLHSQLTDEDVGRVVNAVKEGW